MSQKVHGNEKVVLKINPSRWNYWHAYAALFGGSILFPPALLGIPILEYYRKTTQYLVTSERVIKKKAFITKKVDSLMHDAIINVHVGQNMIHRLMNIGTVRVGTQGTDLGHLAFQGVYNPERVGDLIQKTLREFNERRSLGQNPERFNEHA